MSEALIMRDLSIAVTDADREAAQKVMTQGLRGIDEKNHKRWIRFLREVFALEHGEIAKVATKIPRSGPFHRFHMAIEQAVFDAQERLPEFRMFRDWLKIGSGHVVWVPGAKGGIVPLPRSTSYAELEEDEMREVHDSMMAFLRGPHAARFLWKHLTPANADEMMHAVLEQFDREEQRVAA